MSDLSLSVVVMTHPARLDMAEELARSLAPWPVEVVVDPRPHEGPSTLRTSVEAWAAVPEGATHHMVLQDDVIPVPGFIERVHQEILRAGDRGVAYCADWSSRNGAVSRMGAVVGAHAVETVPDYVPCVALSLPRSAAEGYARFAREWPDRTDADDVVMLRYTEAAGVVVQLALPHLVAHEQLPSLAGNDAKGQRNSACFWQGLPEDPGTERPDVLRGPLSVPYLKHGRAWVYGRTREEGNVWETLPAEDSERWTGLGARALDSALDAGRPDRAGAWYDTLRERVPDAQLDAVWTTAFLMGHYRRGVEPYSGFFARPGSAPDEELLREALRTLSIGGLFPVVAHEVTGDLSQELTELARLGFAAGGIENQDVRNV
ncbi:hypothetical protein ACFRMO_00095 [Streptomyces anulatus]|uniref:hypothetical protein n=1 Tax=Streptomyces TaxID=1883 RepID=UPI00093BF808|nr:hypothetical protein [Streptomyces sp. TSRI0395]WUD89642.1 hypothetical protein OG703_16295 [Streptomyces anulatus]